jgi:hypothetical protein
VCNSYALQRARCAVPANKSCGFVLCTAHTSSSYLANARYSAELPQRTSKTSAPASIPLRHMHIPPCTPVLTRMAPYGPCMWALCGSAWCPPPSRSCSRSQAQPPASGPAQHQCTQSVAWWLHSTTAGSAAANAQQRYGVVVMFRTQQDMQGAGDRSNHSTASCTILCNCTCSSTGALQYHQLLLPESALLCCTKCTSADLLPERIAYLQH